MSERALKATAHLEKDWEVEWMGWKLCSSWPMKEGSWVGFHQDKQLYIQSRCYVGDEEKESSVLGHAKDESRLRLRMYLYEHLQRDHE